LLLARDAGALERTGVRLLRVLRDGDARVERRQADDRCGADTFQCDTHKVILLLRINPLLSSNACT
jgi:hypothetical protein